MPYNDRIKAGNIIMKLLIHDLEADEFKKIEKEYSEDFVISDKGTIKPCIGCFGCWKKDPGRCIIKDGYEDMGRLIHEAEEVIVISRYTYGGFSSFVKNVFDRSLGYVLPHFELVNGQSHHRKRYDEDKAFTFLFYGLDLNEEKQKKARDYVAAVCTNIRGHVKEVVFKECEEEKIVHTKEWKDNDQILLLNASMRKRGLHHYILSIWLPRATV